MSDVKKVKSPKSPETLTDLKTVAKPEDVELKEASKTQLRKINALKNLQFKMLDVESKFYDEVHELEVKYAKLFEPFYEQRRQLVSGEHEPTDEEATWVLDELNGEDDKNQVPNVLSELKAQLKQNGNQEEKGIENFWLETLQSFRITSEIIQEHDEPILSYLKDVTVKLFEKKPYGYTLEFHFAENPYFTNKVLTKTYTLKTEVDPKDPFSYDGPDLDKAVGCKIDWKPNQNVTVKVVKKKLKPRNKKAPPKIVTKEEKQDSFFNFFDTPKAPDSSKSNKSPAHSGAEDHKKENNKQVALRNSKSEDDDHNDDEEDENDLYLMADFEIGQYLKEKIIPKAILFYTGEGIDDDFDYEDEDDEDDEDENEDGDEDEDDEDEDEDEDEEEHGKKSGKGGKKLLAVEGKSGKAGKPGKAGEQPPECKQN